jgi:hypothetical protein
VRGARVGELCDVLAEGRSDDEATALAFSLLSRWMDEALLRAPG